MHAQVGTIYEQQKAIGYESAFIEGEAESMRYMKGLFHDWQAKNITSVLHEKRGGYANNMASLRGLAGEGDGARASRSSRASRSRASSSATAAGAITAVLTRPGRVACDHVVVGVGPWINSIWNMLDLPKTVSDQGPRRQAARRHADVALHGAAGRHARRRSRLPEDQRRPDAAGDPRRHRCAASFRPRRAS